MNKVDSIFDDSDELRLEYRLEEFGVMVRGKYTGSTLDDFLAEEGILDEVTARAHKRLLALQLQDATLAPARSAGVNEVQISKSELAGRLQTSRSQVDRLLDPDNTAVTLDSLERLARVVGKQLIVRLS